jgi:hypothetical protein
MSVDRSGGINRVKTVRSGCRLANSVTPAALDPTRGSSTDHRPKKAVACPRKGGSFGASVDRGGDRPPRSPALFDSERLVPLSSDDDFVLVKQVFEFAPVGLPPCALQWINQNLDGNYVIALHRAAAVPKALGRCSGLRRQAPERFGQLRADLVVVICWEALTRVVVNGEKDLHEMWHSRAQVNCVRPRIRAWRASPASGWNG